MLEKSDTSLAAALSAFNAYGVKIGFLVPTPTGLRKSIMDATHSFRDFLLDTELHDYDEQGQGPDHKIKKRVYLIEAGNSVETTASLYRPNTKNGDPRVWFSGLPDYVEPWNLLAVLADKHSLYVVNCSRPEIMETISQQGSPLANLLHKIRDRTVDPVVDELREKIREIAKRGFIKTLRPGDTGVGMTLETELGIAANAKKAPDFKGIELKAKRVGKGMGNRATLFSQVPNWKLSPVGSAWNLLTTYGYFRDGKMRLNHTIRTSKPNSIGFLLDVDQSLDWLKQNHIDPYTAKTKHVATWEMQKLRDRLVQKHPQTFWVSAECRGTRDTEEFHYTKIEHTKKPSPRNFEALLESGLISVDYLMKENGPNRVRDHGYLFKIHPKDFRALFPPSVHYDLLT